MDMDLLWLTLDAAVTFLLPLILFATVYIYYKQFPGFLEECGLSMREVGLLLIGSLVGLLGLLLLIGQIPIIIWGNSLMAISVGGALIPIVISVYFVKQKLVTDWNLAVLWYALVAVFSVIFAATLLNLYFLQHTSTIVAWMYSVTVPYLLLAIVVIFDGCIAVVLYIRKSSKGSATDFILLLVGVQIASFITWSVSYIMEGTGIVSEFPWYLLPGGISAFMGLIIYYNNLPKAVPFAYISASIGTLIGADISRVPILFRDFPNFTGSIGGAGPLDMVFLSGLIAIVITFLFASAKVRAIPRSKSWTDLSDKRKDTLLSEAENAMSEKKYADAIVKSISAIDELINRLNRRIGAKGDSDATLVILGIHPLKIYDYRMLKNTGNQKEVTEQDAMRGVATAKFLVRELEIREGMLFASTGQRCLAFLIDFGIILAMVIPLLIVGLYRYVIGSAGLLDPWLIAAIMWAGSSQLIYFTICEWLWGQSLGKKVIRIMVVGEDQSRCGFIQAFTRNVIRLLEFTLLYIPAILSIVISRKKQRLGDIISKTAVIRI